MVRVAAGQGLTCDDSDQRTLASAVVSKQRGDAAGMQLHADPAHRLRAAIRLAHLPHLHRRSAAVLQVTFVGPCSPCVHVRLLMTPLRSLVTLIRSQSCDSGPCSLSPLRPVLPRDSRVPELWLRVAFY